MIGSARLRYLSGIGAMRGGCCVRVYEGNGGRDMVLVLYELTIMDGGIDVMLASCNDVQGLLS